MEHVIKLVILRDVQQRELTVSVTKTTAITPGVFSTRPTQALQLNKTTQMQVWETRHGHSGS